MHILIVHLSRTFAGRRRRRRCFLFLHCACCTSKRLTASSLSATTSSRFVFPRFSFVLLRLFLWLTQCEIIEFLFHLTLFLSFVTINISQTIVDIDLKLWDHKYHVRPAVHHRLHQKLGNICTFLGHNQKSYSKFHTNVSHETIECPMSRVAKWQSFKIIAALGFKI